MAKPWGVHIVIRHPDGSTSNESIWAYHLEDLIDRLQERMDFTATFRLRVMEGTPLDAQGLARELQRNYLDGRPDEHWDEVEVRIEHGAVVAETDFG